jgi:hypothetical protein
MKSILLPTLLLQLATVAQTTTPTGYPAPPPGAPEIACSTDGVDASAPVRILLGPDPVPYAFGCAQHGKPSPCIGGTLNPGLVVSVAATSREWSCIPADGVSGWVPASRLAELPTTPAVPLKDWIGWWHSPPFTPNQNNDRLLITPGAAPGTLHVGGRAYWYGANDDVHFGGMNADAKPIGPYLHIVEGDTLSGCILDLHFDPANHTFTAYDNANCGGMNVRFSGKWTRFSPSIVHRK